MLYRSGKVCVEPYNEAAPPIAALVRDRNHAGPQGAGHTRAADLPQIADRRIGIVDEH